MDEVAVENNIHYPTDSSLLGDGVRVLTRIMRKITQLTGQVGAKLRDRGRSVGLRLLEIARAARGKAPPRQAKMKLAYGRLLNATGRVVGQAKRFSKEIATGVKHSITLGRAGRSRRRRKRHAERNTCHVLGGHWPWRRPQASGSYSEP